MNNRKSPHKIEVDVFATANNHAKCFCRIFTVGPNCDSKAISQISTVNVIRNWTVNYLNESGRLRDIEEKEEEARKKNLR